MTAIALPVRVPWSRVRELEARDAPSLVSRGRRGPAMRDGPRPGTGIRGDPTEEAAISTVERTPGEAQVPGIRRGDFLRRTAVAGLGVAGAGALLASANAEGNGGPVSSPLDALGLHNRINRIDRVVANVSNLEKSKAFWEAATPLKAYAQTTSPQQAFANL